MDLTHGRGLGMIVLVLRGQCGLGPESELEEHCRRGLDAAVAVDHKRLPRLVSLDRQKEMIQRWMDGWMDGLHSYPIVVVVVVVVIIALP